MAVATRHRQSTGSAGEEAAQYWCQRHGWRMKKVEPPVRNLGPVGGRPGIFRAVYTAGGLPDFIGWHDREFRYLEAKEAARGAKTFPHSGIDPEQHDYLEEAPEGCSFVGVLWSDGVFEVFPYQGRQRGSYRRGTGIT